MRKEQMTKLLVYGTLKSDGALHKALEGSKLIDKNYITFSKRFVMTSAGGNSFPYIYEKENGGGFAVKGELYEVNDDTLRHTNMIELGAGYEFREIDTDVFGYVYPEKVGQLSKGVVLDYENRFWEWKNVEV